MKKDRYITLDIEKLPEGYYVATSRDVQGLVAQAETFEKTVKIAEDVAKKLLRAQDVGRKSAKHSLGRIIYPVVISA
jgi:predicted RNase H-like HicB family nuclease